MYSINRRNFKSHWRNKVQLPGEAKPERFVWHKNSNEITHDHREPTPDHVKRIPVFADYKLTFTRLAVSGLVAGLHIKPRYKFRDQKDTAAKFQGPNHEWNGWLGTTGLGLVVRTHGPQWRGCGFYSPCRCGAHQHSPPNYDGVLGSCCMGAFGEISCPVFSRH